MLSLLHPSVDKNENNLFKKNTKNLTLNLKKHNGRNNQGKITVRHKGGGLKKRYNLVDYTNFL